MKFVCDRCQTKYSIADERVRGKILKVKCKSCANVITVREERRPSAAGLATISATGHDSERTVLAPNPALFAEPPRRTTGPIATVPAPDDGLAWYMALAGEQTGPFTRKQLVDKVLALPKNADLHVWNEKLGAWKPPADVPAVANDLAARRKSPPALPPGAPRRGTPPAPQPPMGAPAHDKVAHHRPTGASMAVASGSALSPGIGLKLPPPTGGTQPRPSLSASGHGGAAAAVRVREAAVDIDPSSMLETPAPQPHMLHAHGTNGASNGAGSYASASASASATRSSSDVLKLLNLPGAPTSASQVQPGPAPRLMSSAAAVGWTPSGEAPAARARTARLIFGFLGVIGLIIVVIMASVMKKSAPSPIAAPKTAVSDPLAGVVDKMGTAQPAPSPPPPVVAPVPEPPAPVAAHGAGANGTKGVNKGRGARGAHAGVIPPAAPGPTPVVDNATDRYRDTGPGIKVNPLSSVANRPAPSQAQITAVVTNNRGGIKTCYQRALARDNSLTHGKITVKLSLGISGRVKQINIDGPSQFRALDPCIKEVVSRWVFPQAPEEYAFEFPLVFQGNE